MEEQMDEKIRANAYFVVVGNEARDILYGVLSVRFYLDGQNGETPIVLRQGLAYCPPLEMHVLYRATFRLSREEMKTDDGGKVAFLGLVDCERVAGDLVKQIISNCPDLEAHLKSRV
jgi:hypothetical protein